MNYYDVKFLKKGGEMKTLHVYNVARLQQMELIPMLRETVSDTEKKAAVLLGTDAPLKRYLHNVKDGIDPFEVVTRNPQKDPYTQVLNEKDRLRDVAVSRFGRKLQYYEYAEKEAERKAFDALDALWAHHRSLPRLNVKKQTGATDNFLNDLTKEPYASAISTLGMQPEVDAVRATNNDYRAAAADRRATTAEQPVADIKAMRRTLVADYTALCNYIVTMANAYPDDVAWDELLTAINVIRKRYADLLARRAGTKKEEQS